VAERRARIEFGGQERFKEEIREQFRANFIGILIPAVRLSLRVLRRTPGFTVFAILKLALAMAANAVICG